MSITTPSADQHDDATGAPATASAGGGTEPPAAVDRASLEAGGGARAALGGPFPRLLAWLLAGGGLLGLYAAADLTYERLRLALDPNYTPSCAINPLVDCGAVATSPQATFFGDFPNTVLGVAAFSVVATLGVVALTGGRLSRGVLLGLNLGALAGVAFVHYLIRSSLFVIGVLCPWCMVVWAVTVPIFWYVTLHNAASGVFGERVARSAVVRTLVGVHLLPVLLWYVAVAAVVGVVFADSWAVLL